MHLAESGLEPRTPGSGPQASLRFVTALSYQAGTWDWLLLQSPSGCPTRSYTVTAGPPGLSEGVLGGYCILSSDP